MDSDNKEDGVKTTLVGLAVTAGMFAIAAAITDAVERRARIKENIEHAKAGKSLGALWERQRKFERSVADYQAKQHDHFEEMVVKKVTGLERAVTSALTSMEEIAKRLEASKRTEQNGEDKAMPKYPFGDDRN